MANVRGRRPVMAVGERLSTLTPLREKIVPASGWTEDSKGHYLLVDLPGFKKEEVKLEVNLTAANITVAGQRQVNEREHVYFEENFTMPANSDVDKITGKFDAEILYVTVPKVIEVVQEKKEPEIKENQNVQGAAAENTDLRAPKTNEAEFMKEDEATDDKVSNKSLGDPRIFFSPENIRKWENEDGILRSAMEMLSKNKGIVITVILAFSLGMLVSRKLETG